LRRVRGQQSAKGREDEGHGGDRHRNIEGDMRLALFLVFGHGNLPPSRWGASERRTNDIRSHPL
jgi:hypothetical protein